MTDRPTDRPDRHSTMAPPPDRERKTDPPLPTDKPPPEELLAVTENVFPRLAAIEAELRRINTRCNKIDELHALFMGAPAKEPGGKPTPSVVSALHALGTNVGVAGLNAEIVAEQQKTLPQLVAQEVANKLLAMFQGELASLKEADAALLARVDKLAETAGAPSTNGNGPHK